MRESCGLGLAALAPQPERCCHKDRRPIPSVQRALGFVPSSLESWAQIGDGLLCRQRRVPRRETRAATHSASCSASLTSSASSPGRDPVDQSLYIWSKTLPNYILSNLGDRMEMAHSVEGRLPFLDHHVRRGRAYAGRDKINGMTEKYVLREATRPVLTRQFTAGKSTHSCRRRPRSKRPAALYTLVQDTLRGSLLMAPGFSHCKKVTPLLDALPAMDCRRWRDALSMWISSVCLLHQTLVAEPRATLVG